MPEIPETITDEEMADLRRRAADANPKMTSVTDNDAIRRRIHHRDQARNAGWS